MTTAVRDTTLVAAGSGTGTNGDTPAGTAAGDIVLAFGHINNNPTWIDNNGGNAFTKDIAYEPATNEALHSWSIRPTGGNITGWGGTPDFLAGASTRWSISLVAISDPDPSVIFDVTPSTSHGTADPTGASTTVTVVSLTATTACLLFVLIGADGNGSSISTTDMVAQGFTVLENGGNQAQCLLVKQVAAGATGALSFTSAVPGATQWVSMPYLVRMASSGLATGRADETDTALAPSSLKKQVAAGLSSETDSALARTLGRAVPAGSSVETDSALAPALTKQAAPGVTAETDSALARTLGRAVPAGLSMETDTALALALTSGLVPGVAEETDSALARTLSRAVPAGLSAETDSALAPELTSGLVPGVAVESDSALARTLSKATSPGVAAETDVAKAPTFELRAGVAVEDDAALPLDLSGGFAVGLASETDTALAPGIAPGSAGVYITTVVEGHRCKVLKNGNFCRYYFEPIP
jgi:hypothetical protein